MFVFVFVFVFLLVFVHHHHPHPGSFAETKVFPQIRVLCMRGTGQLGPQLPAFKQRAQRISFARIELQFEEESSLSLQFVIQLKWMKLWLTQSSSILHMKSRFYSEKNHHYHCHCAIQDG